jgi:hypothetical protein
VQKLYSHCLESRDTYGHAILKQTVIFHPMNDPHTHTRSFTPSQYSERSFIDRFFRSNKFEVKQSILNIIITVCHICFALINFTHRNVMYCRGGFENFGTLTKIVVLRSEITVNISC